MARVAGARRVRALRGPQGAAARACWRWRSSRSAAGSSTTPTSLNEYLPDDVALDRAGAATRRTTSKYKDLPQPRIVDVRADVDIYPGRAPRRDPRPLPARQQARRADPRAARLHAIRARGCEVDCAGRRTVVSGRSRGSAIASTSCTQPLAPGAAMDFDFTVERAERGFTNSGMPPSTGAATCARRSTQRHVLQQQRHVPALRLQRGAQILDRNERRKRGLGDVPRMAKLEDEAARGSIDISRDADWINFETTVSTSADQIALAPGYLQREWTENGRRYFHYKMDRADAAVLLLPVGALGGEARRVARHADRGLLRPEARLQRRPHDRRDARSRSTTSPRTSRRTSTARCASSSSRATRASRRASPNTIPFSESDRLHRRPARSGRHRLRVLRHRARGRAPVVGAPGDRRGRAGRDDARRVAGAVLGADGDGEGVRPRADAPLPASTSWTATCAAAAAS